VVLARGPTLDEQATRLIQQEHRDRAVKATRCEMRFELGQRTDREPSWVDEFD
jgi:hypothetical protein